MIHGTPVLFTTAWNGYFRPKLRHSQQYRLRQAPAILAALAVKLLKLIRPGRAPRWIMPTKRLVILANSYKKGEHCVAGREIIDTDDVISYGNWIRPISNHGEGELTTKECTSENGQIVDVWHVADIPLQQPAPSPAQPENWLIEPNAPWTLVSDIQLPQVPHDQPPDLWLSGYSPDRISPAALAALGRNQSLYLIGVQNFHLKFQWSHFENGYHKRRALFTYNGQDYDLSITDPAMTKHFGEYPQRGVNKTIELPSGNAPRLCISLTNPFNGAHFKVVATVLDQ